MSSEITTIHIALKKTETLSWLGGRPTPNCLCQVTQTAFQFVYKLESGIENAKLCQWTENKQAVLVEK